MNTQTRTTADVSRQRAAARRTALTVGLIALAIYTAFLLRGYLGG